MDSLRSSHRVPILSPKKWPLINEVEAILLMNRPVVVKNLTRMRDFERVVERGIVAVCAEKRC
ncbi:hypothetical protein APED_13470 [Acanthopleuribacter pedis]